MLELVDVQKDYESPMGGAVTVLKNVNLRIEEGASMAVVGPSGCGKSTLLNIMGALDRPTAGRVSLDGTDLSSLNESELAEVRNRRIGFVFQLHHLLGQCTVLENVLLPRLACGGVDEPTRSRAAELLDRVGLTDVAKHRPGELSGGQRQRVAVVRALINEPAVLLADEPTGSLDEATSTGIADLLVELNRDVGLTLVVVTHSMSLAKRMGTVRRLHDGTLQGKAYAS